MDLAEALALREGTYFHNGLKRQFSDLLALRALPERFEERYLAVLKGETPREIGDGLPGAAEKLPLAGQRKTLQPGAKRAAEPRSIGGPL